MVKNGYLITIEGISGVGKTIIGKELTQLLEIDIGNVIFLGNFQTNKDSLLVQEINKYLSKDRFLRLNWERETALLIAELLERIEEDVIVALSNGVTIIYECYINAIIAYQSARLCECNAIFKKYDNYVEYTRKIVAPFFKYVPEPDIQIFVNCSKNIIKKRLIKRDNRKYSLKDQKLQENINISYSKLYNDIHNILTIDTSRFSKEELLNYVKALYREEIKNKIKL